METFNASYICGCAPGYSGVDCTKGNLINVLVLTAQKVFISGGILADQMLYWLRIIINGCYINNNIPLLTTKTTLIGC